MFHLERKVRRFDVACALEKAFEHNEWKGNPHHKGIFFTTEKGYCVNKVIAVCIEHEERSNDIYYDFDCDCLENKVLPFYPFQGMSTKPKKHHLLFDEEELEKRELDKLFVSSEDDEEFVFAHKELLEELSNSLPNKRERDRTFVELNLDECIGYRIIRPRKGEVFTVSSGIIHLLNEKTEEIFKVIKVNANALHTALQLFDKKSEVSFQVAHDRIKITGELSTLEGKRTYVCAVLALLKG